MIKIKNFFHQDTNTFTFLLTDPNTKDSVIIDPVLDYEQAAGRIFFDEFEKYKKYIKENDLNLLGIIETHAHADHLSSSYFLKQSFPNLKVAINSRIIEVQEVFNKIFEINQFSVDGSQFDLLVKDGEQISFGSLSFKVISTPGHTPACTCYLIEDHLFVGDSIFMEDQGTGRCDFPGGDAKQLYQSIKNKIYSLPEDTNIYVGHDYCPGGRELKFQTTVKRQKEKNIHLNQETTEKEFLNLRTTRDQSLKNPRLLIPSIQVNINAGKIPFSNQDKLYLKTPIIIDETH